MQTSQIVQVDRVPLAFGLDWVPLLGDEAAAAPSIARHHAATHLVLSGNPPAALGLARGLRHKGACWSAADLLARQHPTGTVVRLFALSPQRWHVLACHEGVALARADRSYPDRALACEAVETLRLSHPQLELLEDPASAATDSGAWLRRLAQVAGSTAPLRPVARGLRRGFWAGAASLALVAVLGRIWFASAAAADDSASVRLAWDRAFERVLARHPVHGPEGTRDLLRALYRQPVDVAGWVLQSVRCEGGLPGAPWHCLSEYRRAHAAADNRGLLQAAPTDWRLDFPSLDRAHARWPLALSGKPADRGTLPASPMLARDWASALQEVLPAFSGLQLEPPRPLAIPPPRDAEGRELARPDGLPALAIRALHLQGPLQSASLMVPLAQSVSWQKAVLTHAPGTRPGVRSSRLVLHLEGFIHESV